MNVVGIWDHIHIHAYMYILYIHVHVDVHVKGIEIHVNVHVYSHIADTLELFLSDVHMLDCREAVQRREQLCVEFLGRQGERERVRERGREGERERGRDREI